MPPVYAAVTLTVPPAVVSEQLSFEVLIRLFFMSRNVCPFAFAYDSAAPPAFPTRTASLPFTAAAKALAHISVTESGTVKYFIELYANANDGIFLIFVLFIVTLPSFLHCAKAPSPILSTEEGITAETS